MNKIRRKKIVGIFILVGFLFIVDRILKYWALYGLYHTKINILKGLLTFELFKNYYIAFNIPLPSFLSIPIIITIITILMVLFVQRIKVYQGYLEAGLLLMVVGALSNVYDRLQYGFVIDYLNFYVWPVFNAADVMIGLGAFLIACCLWRHK